MAGALLGLPPPSALVLDRSALADPSGSGVELKSAFHYRGCGAGEAQGFGKHAVFCLAETGQYPELSC